MLFLKPNEIIIPDNRIRKEFNEEHLAELGASISSKGLLNPITVRKVNGSDSYELVAGENRLRALDRMVDLELTFECNGEAVPAGTVPCLLLSDLPEDLRLEAELEENTHRRDLTWQEQAEARARLLALRRAQHPEGFSAANLAEELTRSGAPVQRDAIQSDIRVARFLDKPEVRNAKTKKEALNIIKKEQTNFFLQALGDEVKKEEELYSHKLIEGDCREKLLSLPDSYFSLILTDPPYGIDVQDAGSQVSHAHHYDDSIGILENILAVVPDQLYRVTLDNAHLYWFCDFTWFGEISSALADAGWEVDRYPLIWNKNGRGIAPDTQYRHRRTYECILFASKGNRPLLKLQPDVITISPTADLQQAEKPVELLQELLSRSAQPGDRVLDPFVGSGSLFPAATKAGVFATGVEIDPTRANLARSRLDGSK